MAFGHDANRTHNIAPKSRAIGVIFISSRGTAMPASAGENVSLTGLQTATRSLYGQKLLTARQVQPPARRSKVAYF